MIKLNLPLLALVVASACLVASCRTSPRSEGSTRATEPQAQSSAANEAAVVGTPAKGSKFTKLKMGMSVKQVTDAIGEPTAQGAYITGKAFIPFYYGGDRYRHELRYKGQGRLVFAGGSAGNLSGSRLIQIMHNADEPGYR